jgi:Protein of unknown function (DUF2934)
MAREVAITRISETESTPSTPATTTQRTQRATPVVKGNFLRPLYLVPHRLSPAERHRRISDLAYRRAEMRGFAPGHEHEDWLDAEREVDEGRF